ncbi:unnamed protein product [Prorocentrum cordatum]|uniref:Uncharacterized protein n=1 Tax=Prorocentrum cordatum TaxID=2364126 RepID=A0ABN9Y2R5_9DINO|nr:unnamed protein product [Polarella glacialis]
MTEAAVIVEALGPYAASAVRPSSAQPLTWRSDCSVQSVALSQHSGQASEARGDIAMSMLQELLGRTLITPQETPVHTRPATPQFSGQPIPDAIGVDAHAASPLAIAANVDSASVPEQQPAPQDSSSAAEASFVDSMAAVELSARSSELEGSLAKKILGEMTGEPQQSLKPLEAPEQSSAPPPMPPLATMAAASVPERQPAPQDSSSAAQASFVDSMAAAELSARSSELEGSLAKKILGEMTGEPQQSLKPLEAPEQSSAPPPMPPLATMAAASVVRASSTPRSMSGMSARSSDVEGSLAKNILGEMIGSPQQSLQPQEAPAQSSAAPLEPAAASLAEASAAPASSTPRTMGEMSARSSDVEGSLARHILLEMMDEPQSLQPPAALPQQSPQPQEAPEQGSAAPPDPLRGLSFETAPSQVDGVSARTGSSSLAEAQAGATAKSLVAGIVIPEGVAEAAPPQPPAKAASSAGVAEAAPPQPLAKAASSAGVAEAAPPQPPAKAASSAGVAEAAPPEPPAKAASSAGVAEAAPPEPPAKAASSAGVAEAAPPEPPAKAASSAGVAQRAAAAAAAPSAVASEAIAQGSALPDEITVAELSLVTDEGLEGALPRSFVDSAAAAAEDAADRRSDFSKITAASSEPEARFAQHVMSALDLQGSALAQESGRPGSQDRPFSRMTAENDPAESAAGEIVQGVSLDIVTPGSKEPERSLVMAETDPAESVAGDVARSLDLRAVPASLEVVLSLHAESEVGETQDPLRPVSAASRYSANSGAVAAQVAAGIVEDIATTYTQRGGAQGCPPPEGGVETIVSPTVASARSALAEGAPPQSVAMPTEASASAPQGGEASSVTFAAASPTSAQAVVAASGKASTGDPALSQQSVVPGGAASTAKLSGESDQVVGQMMTGIILDHAFRPSTSEASVAFTTATALERAPSLKPDPAMSEGATSRFTANSGIEEEALAGDIIAGLAHVYPESAAPTMVSITADSAASSIAGAPAAQPPKPARPPSAASTQAAGALPSGAAPGGQPSEPARPPSAASRRSAGSARSLSAGTSGACSVEEDAIAHTMVSGMSDTARAEMWAARSQELPAEDAGSPLPAVNTAYLQATFDEPADTSQTTTFYPAGSWVATKAAPGMDSTLLPGVDEDAHDGLDLKFDVEYQKVDHSVFKQQLFDGLVDLGVQKKSLAVVDVALREGSVIAELRGPHFVIEEIRGRDLNKLEIMGKPAHVSPYPPLGKDAVLPSLMEGADGQRSEAQYSTTSSALQDDFMRTTASRLADSALLQEALEPEAELTADSAALQETLHPMDDAGAELSEVGLSAASSDVEEDLLRTTASRLADAATAREAQRPDSRSEASEEVLSTRGADRVAVDMASDLAAAAGDEGPRPRSVDEVSVTVATTEAENDASRRAAQRAVDKAARMAQERCRSRTRRASRHHQHRRRRRTAPPPTRRCTCPRGRARRSRTRPRRRPSAPRPRRQPPAPGRLPRQCAPTARPRWLCRRAARPQTRRRLSALRAPWPQRPRRRRRRSQVRGEFGARRRRRAGSDDARLRAPVGDRRVGRHDVRRQHRHGLRRGQSHHHEGGGRRLGGWRHLVGRG